MLILRKLFFPILITTIITITIKVLVIFFDLNVLEMGSLLNSLIGGTIFMFGVILSSVFSEYRETTKIPDEMGNHLESLFEDVQNIDNLILKKELRAEYISNLDLFYNNLNLWIERSVSSRSIFESINKFAIFINSTEKILPANYIVRMRNELFNVRKVFIKLDYARDVNVSKYLEIASLLFSTSTIFTLMCTRFENNLTGLWSVGLLTLFFSTIYFIIKILDNPIENKLINFDSVKKARNAIFNENDNINKKL